MNRDVRKDDVPKDDLRKLIGGYPTGTLTAEERALLFGAALDDQDLFDELADEHALKELLDEPGVRQRLLQGLAPRPEGQLGWWMRPWPVSALGTASVAILIAISVLRTPPAIELPLEIAAVTSGPGTAASPVNAPLAVEDRKAAVPATPPPAALEPPASLKKAAAQERPADAAPPSAQSVKEAPKDVAKDSAKEPAANTRTEPPAPAAPVSQRESDQRRDQATVGALQAAGAVQEGQRQNAIASAAAAPPALTRVKAALPAAFSWTIANGVLRVIPARNGFLIVEAVPAQRLLATAVSAGSTQQVPITAQAASLRIFFSTTPPPFDALTPQPPVSRARNSGVVSLTSEAASLEIPLQ